MPKATLLLVLILTACDEGTAPAAPSKTDGASAQKAEAKTVDAPPKGATPAAKAEAPAAKTGYAAPADICALPDLSVLGENAGKPGEGYAENESIRFETKGCAFDLVGDSINTVKLFVAVGDDAADRFAFAEEAMNAIPDAFKLEPLSGLGTKAFYAVQLSAEDRRINATIAVHDANLFIEARLIAGGTQAWNANDVRDRMTKLARGVMAKVPKA